MSNLHEYTVPGLSPQALLLLTLVATVATASPALAQNNSLGQKPNPPSSPFQEKSSAPVFLPHVVVTPGLLTERLEAWAKEGEAKQWSPSERVRYYIIKEPADRAEFEALGRYALLILTVVTQSAQELPLKRVYLRMPDREIPLLKIASWRRDVDQTPTYKMYGPYREDGFYLFPLSAYLRVAQLQADLTANRSGLPLLELPYPNGPDWLKTMQNPDALPNALPNLRALQQFIKRETSGFPIPTSLPSIPEARRPAPAAVPQPDEPTKPASLKDLFKK